MKVKRKTIFHIICISLFLFSLAAVYFFRSWLMVNPFEPFALTEIVAACKDRDGNLLVIDKAGERLLKASGDGTLQWQVLASDNGFEKAVRICTDDEGAVYVQDQRILSGIRLKEEAVLKYSPDGTLLKKLRRLDASDDQIRPSIVALFSCGGDAATVIVKEDGLLLRGLDVSWSQDFPLKNASDLVLNAVWDPEEACLYYCTFNGRIYRYTDGRNDPLLYDNSRYVEEFESIPRAISCLDGTLYAADRGLRCVTAIDTADGKVTSLHEDLPWIERETCNSVTSDFSVVSAAESALQIWENNQCEEVGAFTLSAKLRLIACLVWFCLVLLVISFLTDLLLLAFFLLRRAGTMVRIVAAILVGVGALASMLIATLFPKFTQQHYDSKFDKANYCAALTLEHMPIDAFLRLDESSDYLSEDYLAVQRAVNSIFKVGSDTVKDLYCTMYRVFGDYDTITLTYSMDENSMLLPYDWEYEDSEEQAILTTGVGRQYVNRSLEGSYLFVLNPIFDPDGKPVGLIEVGTDLQSFESEMQNLFRELLLNLIAITAVGVMCLIEVIYFLEGRRKYHSAPRCGEAGLSSVPLPAGMLRLIVFLVFFFTNLTTAVLPTYAMKLASGIQIPGLSTAVLSAIPFSAEVVAGALFSVLGAGMIRKLSLKHASLLSAALFSAGLALRIVPSFWMITLGSLVIGIGWGVILLIVNVLIAGMPGNEKDTGFAYYNAAALNGINSGTVFGGFLLNWLPNTALFALTAVGSLALLVLTWKYLIHAAPAEVTDSEYAQEDGTGQSAQMSWRKFLLSPNILVFFLMLVVPVLICSYFLIYLYPIIGTRWGLSETNIGYSFLLNGLCVMTMSTVMTNLFTKWKKKRLGLTLSALLYALAFSLVALFHSVPALLAALILLGFSDSFGLPLQTSFYTDQKEVVRFGVDRSLGVYSLFENVSQALGPFVFSWALVVGVSQGLYVIAGVIAILAGTFLLAGLAFGQPSRIRRS